MSNNKNAGSERTSMMQFDAVSAIRGSHGETYLRTCRPKKNVVRQAAGRCKRGTTSFVTSTFFDT